MGECVLSVRAVVFKLDFCRCLPQTPGKSSHLCFECHKRVLVSCFARRTQPTTANGHRQTVNACAATNIAPRLKSRTHPCHWRRCVRRLERDELVHTSPTVYTKEASTRAAVRKRQSVGFCDNLLDERCKRENNHRKHLESNAKHKTTTNQSTCIPKQMWCVETGLGERR